MLVLKKVSATDLDKNLVPEKSQKNFIPKKVSEFIAKKMCTEKVPKPVSEKICYRKCLGMCLLFMNVYRCLLQK